MTQIVDKARAHVEAEADDLACQRGHAKAQRRQHLARTGVQPGDAKQRGNVGKANFKGTAGHEHEECRQHRPPHVAGILPAQHAQPRQQYRQQRALRQRAVGVHTVAGRILPEREHHRQQAERQHAQLFAVGGLGGQPGRQGNISIGPGQNVQAVNDQVAQEPCVERKLWRRGKRPEPRALQL